MVEHAALQMGNPGWGDEYPRMMYRAADSMADHVHINTPLLIGGTFTCETRTVANADEQAEAEADGWHASPDPAAQAKQQEARDAIAAKDAEIANLRAQLANASPVKEARRGN